MVSDVHLSSCSPTDMEKFPVRMKDNDLLVTEMFEDPNKDPITALSVFCQPNHCMYVSFSSPRGSGGVDKYYINLCLPP